MASLTEAQTVASGPFAEMSRIFGDPRMLTDGDLLALAFSDDRTLWSVDESGVLRRWDATSGQQLAWRFLSDLEMVWAFREDARLLASASDEVTLWDVPTGQVVATIPQPSWVTAAAFAGKSNVLATGHDDGVVRLWDAQHDLDQEFDGHGQPVSALAFNAERTLLASAGEDRLIHVWDVATGRRLGTLAGHTDRIQALAWHPTQPRLISAAWDTTTRIWDTTRFEPVILLNAHAEQVTAAAFSPRGHFLACADSARAIYLWDPATARILHILKAHAAEVRCLAFSPDGETLASGGADHLINLWELGAGKLRLDQRDAVVDRASLAVSPDGQRLVSTGGGADLREWDTATGKLVLRPEESPVLHTLAYSPDGRWIAGGGPDTHVRLWDAATGRLEATLEGHKGPVSALGFSPDSRLLASVSNEDSLVWLWEVPSGEPVLLIPEAADRCTVEALAFHPGGRLLACGGVDWISGASADGLITLWDVVERSRATQFPAGTRCLAFDPSGRWVAAALDEGVGVWDVESRTLAMELTGHLDVVTGVAYSPNGRWLASCSDDRTVRLWDAATGEARAARQLDTQAKAIGFAPDSRHLFTANANTACYQLEVARLLEAAG
jgi:WD40 repeat protein